MNVLSLVTLVVASETTNNPTAVATTVIDEAYATTVGEISTTEAHTVTTPSGGINDSSKGSGETTRSGGLNDTKINGVKLIFHIACLLRNN